MTESINIGTVILAAGSSSRLGRPKQLLKYQNKTLLQHIIDTVTPFEFNPSVLVLGAYADQIRDATNLVNVTAIYNKDWPEGIASSIRVGVAKSLKLNASLDSILFLLSDQPFVSTDLIQDLIDKHNNRNQRITACCYKQNVGVPAIFQKHFFPELQELSGDVGAKKIIIQNSEEVEEVPFKKGSFDIDTSEDYEQLKDNANRP
ncbi:nucleotidyltransferase family protein [Aliifodinibius sp. S!AR15-10]|uniref:nucleotidyltransferase family protein n=1 Tax=Aliifodinibius sp. S!AR15-10 TaxID=2950437 RepID=UPI002855ED27|nr:nucleotidyltransferase family protein [Aliifodinibius sp. S!AR15-10]MDR8394044.1 nucleotidyltransferase family protein [Aliifodinibius sp. S!AR15-10]